MTPEQRQRASLAVRARMNDLNITVREFAREAGVDQKTIRALLGGSRWPRASTRLRLTNTLGWRAGEIERRADARPDLDEYSTLELLVEACRRLRLAEEKLSTRNAF